MIQTTNPPAASKKWLRISGGRIRLPASCCWRIPPRISQIESSMKPPPAVITQAISAAHFITPPLDRHRERDARLERRSLYLDAVFIKHPASLAEIAVPARRDSPRCRDRNRAYRSRSGRCLCLREPAQQAAHIP